MSSIFGEKLKMSIFGASHGKYIGFTLEGLPAGIKIDFNNINEMLNLRRPDGILSTNRVEDDDYDVISGYFNDFTTGMPLTVLIKNKDAKSNDYDGNIIRPSTSDYVAFKKFDGFNDYRGSGTFSGRMTVALVIAGTIARQILSKKNIVIASKIASIHNINDEKTTSINEVLNFNTSRFPTISSEKKKLMQNCILDAKNNLDSVGGIIETTILNLPIGIGEPFFDSIESVLSKLIFSIPGVKGVEFGDGFKISSLYGSEANDQLEIKEGTLNYLSNHSGGINGGLTNGGPVIIRSAFRPTPSISKEQQTVDINNSKNTLLSIKGRHDPCFVVRARVVVDSVVALGLLDLMGFGE